MDTRKLIAVFRATLEPTQRQQAEEQLNQIKKIIGFAPSLLQLVMSAEVDMPVRQAGAIFLKNMVTANWAESDDPLHFSIHEQDRAMIRDSIVDAVVLAPEVIRTHLTVCVNSLVKHDFPGRWTQIVDKISIYLQNPDADAWAGALLCLFQLVKSFEYKKGEDRGPLNEAMTLLLPMIYQLCVRLLPDESEKSVLLQKQILKIYSALTQFVLPLDLITKEVFAQWMEIVRQVLERPIPVSANTVDEDERPDLPWWKCKKWAIHIISRMFERYGSPNNVEMVYLEFAEWYLKTFTAGLLIVLLKILDQYRRQIYITPRILQQSLTYLSLAVNHAFSWKLLKVHMFAIIQDVVFPLMCHSKEDEELWSSDPREYIRVKYDIFEDYVCPINAAGNLLHSACKKRKNMLNKTMQLVMQILTMPNSDPKQKDGALHMVGILANLLFKKAPYKDQMEPMMVQYVYPEFTSSFGYLRARACWVLHYFNEMKFKNEENLKTAVNFIVNSLLNDRDLPVKVEASIALQILLTSQNIEEMLESQVRAITLELLVIIRETENDDINTVLQKLVCTYSEQIMPIATDMCQHLATTFRLVLETDEGSDEKAITTMGILSTIETLLSVLEEQQEIKNNLEPIVIQVVGHIFTQNITEFYEEALSLVFNLTTKSVSDDMWKMFELIYQVFEKDGFDYFVDMMPCLHNYVTVDTPAFLSNENRVLALYNMCKVILTSESAEDPECYAAKLLEVIILQCKGRIDQCVPHFAQLALQRLTREIKTSELRTMCLQVVIAALYYNPHLLFQSMDKLQETAPLNEPISSHFIKQWIHDTDCFLGLHDRKMCVLGLCTLLTLGNSKPPVINECVDQIIPSLILLFDGLKRAYAAKAQEGIEEEEEEDSSELSDLLSSDEDEIDETSAQYLEALEKKIKNKAAAAAGDNVITSITQTLDSDNDDDDDDWDPDLNEETALETYTTPLDEENCEIDEYVVFKDILLALQTTDPMLYEGLTRNLNQQQKTSLQEVLVLADQRKAAAESKRIEQSGGYVFLHQTVPKTFKFGESYLGR